MKRKNDLIDSKLLENKAEEYATNMSKVYTADIKTQVFLHDALMAAYLKCANDFYQMNK